MILTGSSIENVSQVFGTFAMMFAKLLCTKRFQDLDFHAELHGTRDRSVRISVVLFVSHHSHVCEAEPTHIGAVARTEHVAHYMLSIACSFVLSWRTLRGPIDTFDTLCNGYEAPVRPWK